MGLDFNETFNDVAFTLSEDDKYFCDKLRGISIKMSSAVHAELEVGFKGKVISKTKSVLELLYKNFEKYVKLLKDVSSLDPKHDQKELKELMEVEKLIEIDNKKVKALLKKLETSYNEKEEKDKPRILKGDNKEKLEDKLDEFLKFTQKCVISQKNKIRGNKEIEKLAEVFKKPTYVGYFVENFLSDNVVKKYITKRFSATGRVLKVIYKSASNCKKAFDVLDVRVKAYLEAIGDFNEEALENIEEGEFADYLKENSRKLVSQLKKVIQSCEDLSHVLNDVCRRAVKGKKENKVIALYEDDIINGIKIFRASKVEPYIKLCKKMHDKLLTIGF